MSVASQEPVVEKKGKASMPGWARVFSAVIGVGLCLLGVTVFALVRPLSWQVGSVAAASLGFGLDLLGGAVVGRWPISAFGWLWFHE